MRLSPVLLFCLLPLVLGAAANAQAAFAVETLPPATADGDPSNGNFVDIWVAYCPTGGSMGVQVDTVPLSAEGGSSSPLDPAFYVFDSTATSLDAAVLVAFGDDEASCTIPTACGYDCPAALFNCTEGGDYRIVVWTWGETLDTVYCGQQTGNYAIQVQAFDGPDGTGSPVDPHLGGEPVQASFPGGPLPSGPAVDDKWVVVPGSPLIAPPPAGKGLRSSKLHR